MCASSAAADNRENAIKKETEFQALAKNDEELKTRVEGGRFANEDARVGSKRSAPDEQPLHPQVGPVSALEVVENMLPSRHIHTDRSTYGVVTYSAVRQYSTSKNPT